MSYKKTTKQIVGSSIILGAGSAAINVMGQGAIIPNTLGRASTMMGAVIPAAYGMDVLNLVKKKSRRK